MAALNTLFSTSRHLLRNNNLSLLKKAVGHIKNSHTHAVPPREKLSTSETLVRFTLLSLSMMAIPAWVLYHIPDYQGEDRNAYTGK